MRVALRHGPSPGLRALTAQARLRPSIRATIGPPEGGTPNAKPDPELFLTYSSFNFGHRPREVTMRDDCKSVALNPADNTHSGKTVDGPNVSRRDFLHRACAQAVVVGAVSVTIGNDAKAEYWVWKSTARYQYYPNGPARCAGCANFRPYAACTIVEPPINPDGWCRYFSPIPVVYVPVEPPPPYYPQPYNPSPYPPPYRRPY